MAGQQAASVAQKVWDTDTRRKVTDKVGEGVSAATAKSAEAMRDKMTEVAERQAQETATAVQTRIKETDWKEEAKTTTAKGLRWMSQQLAELTERLNAANEPEEKQPEE